VTGIKRTPALPAGNSGFAFRPAAVYSGKCGAMREGAE
jgi:hypothetical protein